MSNKHTSNQETDCFVPRNDTQSVIANAVKQSANNKEIASAKKLRNDVRVPKLRFKEFKGDWVKNKLGELVEIKSGISPSKYNFIEKGLFPFLKVEELNNCIKYQFESRFYSSENYNLIKKNSIIFPKRGAAILNNKVRILSTDSLMDSNLMALNSNDLKLNNEFLYYKILKEKLYKIADKSTIPQINNKHIEPYKINLPTLKEQQKIATFLTAVDDKIQQLTKKKTILEQYKKGVMQQIFSQQLRFKPDTTKPNVIANSTVIANEERMKQSQDNNEQFPDWEEKRLGELTKIIAGGTPRTTTKEYWNGNIRWMNSGELNLKKVYEVENRITEKGLKNSSTSLLPKYSILIGLAGQGRTRGTVAINLVELCTNQSVAAITPNKNKFNPDFMFQNLDSRYDEIRRLSTGDGGRGGLNLSIIKSIKIKLPSVKEQQKIATYLSALDKKIENVQTQIDKTQLFKKGLLQGMFV